MMGVGLHVVARLPDGGRASNDLPSMDYGAFDAHKVTDDSMDGQMMACATMTLCPLNVATGGPYSL